MRACLRTLMALTAWLLAGPCEIRVKGDSGRSRKNVAVKAQCLTPWLDTDELRQADALAQHVLGVIEYQADFAYDTSCVLTSVQNVQRLHWKLMGASDKDLWFFKVTQLAMFAQPLHVPRFLPHSKAKVYDVVSEDFRAELALHLDERPEWLQEDPEIAFIVPARFAYLICQHRFRSFCLPSPFVQGQWRVSEWKLNTMGHRLAAAFQGRHAPLVAAQESRLFSLTNCQDLADDIRGNMLRLPEQQAHEMKSWVAQLQNTSDDMALPRAADEKFRRLIDFVFFCELLKDVSAAKEAMRRALELTFPKSLLAVAKASLDSDVSLMLWQRAFAWSTQFVQKVKTSRYMMWDSSPQYSRDYEMIRVVSISHRDIRQLFASVKEMSNMWKQDGGLDMQLLQNETASQHAEEQDMFRFAEEVLCPHICPAVLLGFGATSLAHKYHTLAHAFRLEQFNAESLQAYCKEFVSVTSDFGVEHMLSRVGPVLISTECQWFEDADPQSLKQVLKNAPTACSDVQDCVLEDVARDDVLDLAEDAFSSLDDGLLDMEGPIVEPLLLDMSDDDVGDASLDEAAVDPVPLEVEQGDVAGADPAIFEDVPAGPTMEFSDMFSFPGVHHVLDNAVNGFEGAMENYKEYIDMASKLCKFLHKTETRDILLARCFGDAVGQQFHDSFKKFQGNIFPGRWGTVAFSVPQLLALERALRWGWNKVRYLQDANARTASTTCLVEHADSAIESSVFWAWLCMLDHLVFIVRKATAWLESCPCHWELLQRDTEANPIPPRIKRRFRRCPMRGMRAPELCNGELLLVMGLVCEQTGLQLLNKLPRDISAEERAQLLDEFNAGRSHLCFYLAMKLSALEEWPWKVCVLAHTDEDVARQVLGEALASDCGHARLQTLKGELRPLCARWAAGESLHSPGMAALCTFVAELCFVPVNERPAEALHRQTKLHGRNRPRHTVGFMSLKQRMPELKQLLTSRPAVLHDLASLCHMVRNNDRCVSTLGLHLHPSVQQVRGRRNAFRDPLLAQIVYHADPGTLYALPVPELPMDPGEGGDARGGGEDGDDGPGNPPEREEECPADDSRGDEDSRDGNGSSSSESLSGQPPGNPEADLSNARTASLETLVKTHASQSAKLLQKLMLDRLAAILAECKGGFLSLPYTAKATRSLASVLKLQNQQKYELGDDLNLESKLDIRAGSNLASDATLAHRKQFTAAARYLMFFKVVRVNPRKLKRAKVEHEAGFSSSDVVVAPHKLHNINAVAKKVSVEAMALQSGGSMAGCSVVVDFACLEAERLTQVRTWSKSDRLDYLIKRDVLPEAEKWSKNRKEALSILLAELVENQDGARESFWRLARERKDILAVFQGLGWVVQTEVAGVAYGTPCLQVCALVLMKPIQTVPITKL